MKRVLTILGTSLIASILSLLAIRFLLQAQDFEISLHGQIAIAIGVFFSMLVGFGLMTLLFMSNKDGHDQVVYTLKPDHQDDDTQDDERV